MDPTPDPLLVQLRGALRTSLAAVPPRPGVHGPPVTDGAGGPTRAVLDRLGAGGFERPASAGGLGLGLTAGVLVSEELGHAARGNSYRAGATAADAGRPAGAALAGWEALPVGGGVVAKPRSGGWELTGAATVDDPEPAGPLLVAAATGDGPVLVAVERGAPGIGVETGCWPPVVRFDATPFTAADVVAELDDSPGGPLARGRLRQAAYLLGIAEGAHRVAVGYAGVRRQFDTRLRDLPAVAFPLARAMVALRATRAVVYRGAWLADSGTGHGVPGFGEAGSGALRHDRAGAGGDRSGTGADDRAGTGVGSGFDGPGPEHDRAGGDRTGAGGDLAGARRARSGIGDDHLGTGNDRNNTPHDRPGTGRDRTGARDGRDEVRDGRDEVPDGHPPAGDDPAGTAPVVALAMAAETAREVVRLCMQSCGVRAMTAELGLHRYFRLAAAESQRYGEPAALWRLAGAARLDLARRTLGADGADGAEPPVVPAARPR
ncbi:acyl-CoA dehydrogenase family protein [Streptomyces sp. NPDC001889]